MSVPTYDKFIEPILRNLAAPKHDWSTRAASSSITLALTTQLDQLMPRYK